MKLLGTILEWMDMRPDVMLRNDTFMSAKGMVISSVRKCLPVQVTYPAVRADDPEPWLYCGPGLTCPYMVKGTFEWMCALSNWEYGSACAAVLSERMVNDPNWYEWTLEMYEATL